MYGRTFLNDADLAQRGVHTVTPMPSFACSLRAGYEERQLLAEEWATADRAVDVESRAAQGGRPRT